MKKLLIAIFALSLMMRGMALGYSFTDTVGTQPVDITVEEIGDSIKWTIDFPMEAPYDPAEGNGKLAVGLIIATDGDGEGPAFQIHNNDGSTLVEPHGTWMYGYWGPTIGDGWFGWPNHDLDVSLTGLDWVEATGERNHEDNPDGIFTITIDKSELGELFHWALNLAIGTGFWPQYYTYEQMSCPDGEYDYFDWANPIVDMSIPNYEYVPPPPVVDMSSFVIDHAKLDFKKKPDDDKVRVEGKLELDLDNGDDVDIFDLVTVTVESEGQLSEDIYMVEKGKKGEKWEYKRPKGGTGDIKHMTIDWKKGKFDIRMDKADLSGLTDPDNVTISIKIGDDFGEETIEMREKKHHWDYKAKKVPKKVQSLEASKAEESIAQSKFGLSQNYPNPFNPQTNIEYDIEKDSDVTLKIYNLAGQMVKTLVDEYQTVGHYTITWYGDTDAGQEIASGVYFYRIKAGDKAAIKKMVVLK